MVGNSNLGSWIGQWTGSVNHQCSSSISLCHLYHSNFLFESLEDNPNFIHIHSYSIRYPLVDHPKITTYGKSLFFNGMNHVISMAMFHSYVIHFPILYIYNYIHTYINLHIYIYIYINIYMHQHPEITRGASQKFRWTNFPTWRTPWLIQRP